MSYLSLSEAAQYLIHKTGVEVEQAALLRMGVLGHLLIVAYFDAFMRNLSANQNEEVFGHLIVPPRHLATIENEGGATIELAHSLDGNTLFSPQVKRSRDQLRVLVSELDRVAPFFVTIKPAACENSASTAPNVPNKDKERPAPAAQDNELDLTSTSQVSEVGLSKNERKIRAIIAAAQAQGYDPLKIPKGGKTLLRELCKKQDPVLFGGGNDPFDGAWKSATNCNPPRVRMADHDSFAGR